MKKRLKIGIIFDSGDVSCKDRYDSISDAGVMDEVKAVRDSLLRLGHEPILIQIGRRFKRPDRKRIIESLVSDLRKAKPDAVFNLCETFCGDAKLQTVVTRILDEETRQSHRSNAQPEPLPHDQGWREPLSKPPLRIWEMFQSLGLLWL